MVMTTTDLHHDIEEILPGVIADRRHLHEHPELAYQEIETAAFVAERLASIGVDDVRTGIAVTGVTGLIRGLAPTSGENATVLLRADMDALPIEEENDVEYRSTIPGVMHACGHDGHVAMMLAVARLLQDRRDQFSGTVKLLFQPAEEGGAGAKRMIDEGVLSDPDVDYVFGMHIDQDTPAGQISVRPGPMLASADLFSMTVQGKGGHGAQPHLTVDPIAAAAQIVTALQTIVSREVDPNGQAIVTIGSFNAGHASNVIPDAAELQGTLRAFDPEVRQTLARRLEEIATGVGGTLRATVSVDFKPGYPATINDAAMTALVREIATGVVGEENVLESPLRMGSEDFSFFLEEKPGCFYFVGSANVEKGLTSSHHHPCFDFDESAMAAGIEIMAGAALTALQRGGG
jgi:amidohydrolase